MFFLNFTHPRPIALACTYAWICNYWHNWLWTCYCYHAWMCLPYQVCTCHCYQAWMCVKYLVYTHFDLTRSVYMQDSAPVYVQDSALMYVQDSAPVHLCICKQACLGICKQAYLCTSKQGKHLCAYASKCFRKIHQMTNQCSPYKNWNTRKFKISYVYLSLLNGYIVDKVTSCSKWCQDEEVDGCPLSDQQTHVPICPFIPNLLSSLFC